MSDQKLFPYQEDGAEWLASRKLALLADEMGLGKTAQVIRAADDLDAVRILVVCPAAARVNWHREFQRWSNVSREFAVCLSGKDEPSAQGSAIVSYDYALAHGRRLKQGSESPPWDLLVIDEAHFLKSTEAKRAQAILGREGLVRYSNRVWALSGTPAPNHPGELWPILYTFGATKLCYEAFVSRYCTYFEGTYGRQITGANRANVDELRAILTGIMLRRRKDDVMTQLPPILFSDVVVEPGEVDFEVTEAFIQYVFPTDRKDELHEKLKQEEARVTAALGSSIKAMEALAPSVSTLRRYVGCQKIEPVAEMLSAELEADRSLKLVVFAIHKDVIEGLRSKLARFGAVTLYGRTPPEKRQKHVDWFQTDPKTRVFIGNIMAAGTAITLTAAHHVVFIEQDWVPGNNAQAAMRCHRIGQTKPVSVRFIGVTGSIDEKVARVLKRKTQDLTEIFDRA